MPGSNSKIVSRSLNEDGEVKMKTMSVVQIRIRFVNAKLLKAMRRPCDGGRTFITTSLMVGLGLGVIATVITTSRTAAAQSVQFEEIGGTFPMAPNFSSGCHKIGTGPSLMTSTTHNHQTARSTDKAERSQSCACSGGSDKPFLLTRNNLSGV
jgi:hypothetical protein